LKAKLFFCGATGCRKDVYCDGLSEKDPEQSSPEAVLGRILAVPAGRAEFPVMTG